MSNYNDAARFLQAVFGTDWETKAFLVNSPNWGTRLRLDQLDNSKDCYWCVGAIPPGKARKNSSVENVRALVIDDVGTKVDAGLVEKAFGRPTAIVVTSPGNFQWSYRLSKPVPVAEWTGFFRGAEAVIRNPRPLEGRDAAHLFRLPMGVNTKPDYDAPDVGMDALDPGAASDVAAVTPIPGGFTGPSDGAADKHGIDVLQDIMKLIPNTLDARDDWSNIGHDLKALCENDEDGFTVYDEWTETWRGPGKGSDYTRSKWDSFGAGGLKSKGHGVKARAYAADPAGYARVMNREARERFNDDPPAPPSGGGGGGTTHVDMAEDIIRHERGTLGWMSNASSRWAGFDPVMGRWVIEEHDALMRAAVRDEVHTARLGANPATARKMAEAKWRGAVQGLLVRERRLMLPFDGFDADLDTFGVPGGVIRLGADGIVEESGRASQMVSKTMATKPAPRGVRGAAWEKFLDDFTMGDPELRAWWQAFCGYCLTGHTDHHAVVFVYGPGGNGKSVFLDTLAAVMGGYHRRAPHTLFMAQVGSKHMASVADLVGARLVTTPDVPSQASWDLGLVKSLTGGGAFKAQFMRENWFEFVPQFKLVLPGNEKPDFGGSVDRAIRRRFWLVPALHVPKTVNINLVDTLRRELPAVLRWMLDGWEAYNMFGGFPPCKWIERETTDYLDEMDVFGKWKGSLVRAPGDMTRHRIGDLWSQWDAFRAGEGSWKAAPANKGALSTKLREAGFNVDRDNKGGYVDQISITKSTIF